MAMVNAKAKEKLRWPLLFGQVGGANKVESHSGYAACMEGRL
jgi:hypothetical protein